MNEDPEGLVAVNVTFTAVRCQPFAPTAPSTDADVVGAPGGDGGGGLPPEATTVSVWVVVPVSPPASWTSRRTE